MATPSYLTTSVFVGEINITFGTSSKFNDFAAELEVDYINKLLGYELYQEFTDRISEGDDKWGYLRDGLPKGYSDSNGDVHRLRGITVMLKYFFYYHYILDQQSTATSVGDVQFGVQNAEQSAHSYTTKKLIHAYNKGVDCYNELIDYIEFKNSEEGDDYYDGFNPTYIEHINEWGI